MSEEKKKHKPNEAMQKQRAFIHPLDWVGMSFLCCFAMLRFCAYALKLFYFFFIGTSCMGYIVCCAMERLVGKNDLGFALCATVRVVSTRGL